MTPTAHDMFLHVRVVVGVILGLSVGKLLEGLGTIVERPRASQAWAVHLLWVAWALLSLVGFWWWEFQLNQVSVWTFGIFLFLFAYSACYFLICVLLFPRNIEELGGYQRYFIARRRWFFGIVALSFVLDIGDSLLKGADHLVALGSPYALRTGLMLGLCVVGARTPRARLHAALAMLAIAIQASFFFWTFNRLV